MFESHCCYLLGLSPHCCTQQLLEEIDFLKTFYIKNLIKWGHIFYMYINIILVVLD